jgi:hypothetical protein
MSSKLMTMVPDHAVNGSTQTSAAASALPREKRFIWTTFTTLCCRLRMTDRLPPLPRTEFELNVDRGRDRSPTAVAWLELPHSRRFCAGYTERRRESALARDRFGARDISGRINSELDLNLNFPRDQGLDVRWNNGPRLSDRLRRRDRLIVRTGGDRPGGRRRRTHCLCRR